MSARDIASVDFARLIATSATLRPTGTKHYALKAHGNVQACDGRSLQYPLVLSTRDRAYALCSRCDKLRARADEAALDATGGTILAHVHPVSAAADEYDADSVATFATAPLQLDTAERSLIQHALCVRNLDDVRLVDAITAVTNASAMESLRVLAQSVRSQLVSRVQTFEEEQRAARVQADDDARAEREAQQYREMDALGDRYERQVSTQTFASVVRAASDDALREFKRSANALAEVLGVLAERASEAQEQLEQSAEMSAGARSDLEAMLSNVARAQRQYDTAAARATAYAETARAYDEASA